jgi:hypothetical protein
MTLELRDELAARVAAGLWSPTLAPSEVARRAYALADAMVRERAYEYEDHSHEVSGIPEAEDPRYGDPPHDPSWELEPRWARADVQHRDARATGPGLASARPTTKAPHVERGTG